MKKLLTSQVCIIKNNEYYNSFLSYKFIYSQPNIKLLKMTKAEIVNKISSNLGLEKNEVLATVENFMDEVKIL